MTYNFPGLLFYHSCTAPEADFARGRATPTFFDQVSVIEDGARGSAFQCENTQKLAFRADHNIYAERGTLSFWWRSRYPVGPTQFPIFRVAFADHSSWDACWLRIDYNGEGFEAMITDINLSKARVAAKVEPFPAPDVWTHLTLSWDENWGIRFYINGKLAAEEYRPAVYFTGLDQFGTHSRIISNWNVSSDYNFVRGGDVDEIVIYDRMLSDAQIASLAQGAFVTDLEEYTPDLTDKTTADAWLLRCGFAPVAPIAIPDEASVRKVEIHDAYDLKRWWWKACDGIRETTWPGVFNRSRLKGRNDYFQLPDWDCYSLSGKAVTFYLPEEEYNHIEISGFAFGLLESVTDTDEAIETVFDRPAGTERTSVRIAPRTGGRLRFTNVLQEEPIGDFSVFNVQEGTAPDAVKTVSYTLTPGYNNGDAAQSELVYFIKGRYTAYERHIMTATETGEQQPCQDNAPGYPFVNVIVPYEFDESVALDGIALTIPAQESDCDFAIQIRDPLWYHRNLAHFTFHAEAGHAKTIWFDLRDRCLPEKKCLYIQIACSDTAFGTANLTDAKLSLLYKPAEDAKEEHCLDRFTQVRDLYSHLVEEQPGLPEFDMYNRFMADITDLLRIDPKHQPGQFYLYDKRVLCTKYGNNIDYTPDFEVPTAPEGVPEWAFQQVEYLKRYKKLINWWIDNRQIENGEFGGGLSDDGDYTSFWPGLAEMGCDPEKIRASIDRCTDAFYEQGLFTNGLPSIQTDELHTAEEGLISLDQCLSTMYSHPKYLERVMETCRSLEWITGYNCAGHRHIKSSYYSGSRMATEDPWGLQQSLSYQTICPCWQLPKYNGNPRVLKILTELSDGLVAHFDPETNILRSNIRFADDSVAGHENRRAGGEKTLLYAAYKLTGDLRYYEVIPENLKAPNSYGMRLRKDQLPNPGTVDKTEKAEAYKKLNFIAGTRDYYNTLGHPWIDRVYFNSELIQRDRMAGVCQSRGTYMYPQNRFSWTFPAMGDEEKIAVLTPISVEDQVKVLVYNLSAEPVTATLHAREVIPGTWKFTGGIDSTGNDEMDEALWSFTAPFEYSKPVTVTFAPGVTTVIEFTLEEKAVPYHQRCDLGISKEDVKLWPHGLNVKVHSLGAIASEEIDVVLKDPDGNVLRREILPALEAPVDLWPRWREVSFLLHRIESLEGCTVEIDPEHKLNEITRDNNVVVLSGI